eukprot:4591847-Pyramimonas_sp.AAC.1
MPFEVYSALAYFLGQYVRSAALGAPSVRAAQSSRMFFIIFSNDQWLKACVGPRGKPIWDIIGLKFSSK